MKPVRILNSVAPIRVCDNGGWTDTWFAQYGKIFNIAVYPYAEVQVRVFEPERGQSRVVIHAENYGEKYEIGGRRPAGQYGKHPLLEAAFDYMKVPDDVGVEVSIYSDAPAGASTGTSAAVSVALIGALDLLTPGRMTAYEVATAAHAIETKLLKLQSGIQDQLASAYGGINLIDMHAFPHAAVSPILVPDSTWWELESRLALIYVGHPHSSSETHKLVIRELEAEGPEAPRLAALRTTADKSRDALYAGDFAALGRAMMENTRAQAALHPALVGPSHQQIIDVAKAHRAAGWKVNGAGGDGGSVTLLGNGDRSAKRAMLREIEQANPSFKHIPIYLSRSGLRRWEGR
jgi:D-glycero-alpha-D-manno-heptose-7-phosphate kinase